MRNPVRSLLLVAGVATLLATSSIPEGFTDFSLEAGEAATLRLRAQGKRAVPPQVLVEALGLGGGEAVRLVGFVSTDEARTLEAGGDAVAAARTRTWAAGEDAGALGRVAFVIPVPRSTPVQVEGLPRDGTAALTVLSQQGPAFVKVTYQTEEMERACDCDLSPRLDITRFWRQGPQDAGP